MSARSLCGFERRPPPPAVRTGRRPEPGAARARVKSREGRRIHGRIRAPLFAGGGGGVAPGGRHPTRRFYPYGHYRARPRTRPSVPRLPFRSLSTNPPRRVTIARRVVPAAGPFRDGRADGRPRRTARPALGGRPATPGPLEERPVPTLARRGVVPARTRPAPDLPPPARAGAGHEAPERVAAPLHRLESTGHGPSEPSSRAPPPRPSSEADAPLLEAGAARGLLEPPSQLARSSALLGFHPRRPHREKIGVIAVARRRVSSFRPARARHASAAGGPSMNLDGRRPLAVCLILNDLATPITLAVA